MVKRNRLDLKAGVSGDNVTIPISAVNRDGGYPRNTLGVIVNGDLNTDQIQDRRQTNELCYVQIQ